MNSDKDFANQRKLTPKPIGMESNNELFYKQNPGTTQTGSIRNLEALGISDGNSEEVD